jgi:predicted nucleotidyltransferase
VIVELFANHNGSPDRALKTIEAAKANGANATTIHNDSIVKILRARLPFLLATYAFGSRIQGVATMDSDLDLAVLVAGYADPVLLFDLAGEISDVAGCPVDLLDLRAVSTVMQYRIIVTGERWWARDAEASLFEAAILSEKTELDHARNGVISDILERGTIHG